MVRHRIPEGVNVVITAQGKVTVAKVVYCNREGELFKIGVRIDYGRS